jgi:hypothetical protein
MRGLGSVGRLLAIASLVAGCASPEDGRPRGGGPGADGGNYLSKPIHVPSKIDGTKSWTLTQNPRAMAR